MTCMYVLRYVREIYSFTLELCLLTFPFPTHCQNVNVDRPTIAFAGPYLSRRIDVTDPNGDPYLVTVAARIGVSNNFVDASILERALVHEFVHTLGL